MYSTPIWRFGDHLGRGSAFTKCGQAKGHDPEYVAQYSCYQRGRLKHWELLAMLAVCFPVVCNSKLCAHMCIYVYVHVLREGENASGRC